MDACHSRFRQFSLLASVFLAAFALLAAPAYAAEPSPEILAKVTKLNKKAIDAYQKQDFDGARDFLKQALDACNAAHLEHHPITARTEIHIGVLLIGGLKQHDAGIKHFQKALQIQPDIQITKSLVTPELQDAFEEAVLGAGGATAAGGDDNAGGGAARKSPDDDQGGAGAGSGDDNGGGDDDHPRKKVVKKKPKKKRGDDDDSGDDDSGKKKSGDDDDDAAGGALAAGKIFIGLGLGTGFGIASGSGEETNTMAPHKLAGAGFALAQLGQVSPEVGYFLKSDFLLSLQVRYQFVTGLNPGPGYGNVQTSAIAAFVRATWFGGSESFHPFFALAAGGGYIRHALVFNDPHCGPGNMTCVDTIKGGPLLVGPAAGLMFDLSSAVSLLVGLNSQLGVPNFTLNFDINAGLGIRF
jgi:hypothetical protein